MRRVSPTKKRLWAGVLLTASALLTSAAEAADFVCPTSVTDVFTVPSQSVLARYRPGDVLCDLGRVPYAGDASGSYKNSWTKRKLIYVTSNSKGGRTAVSGTLVAPASGGTSDLVAYAPSTVGLIDDCAQSAVIDLNVVRSVAQNGINKIIASGRSAAVPDYEGLGTSEPHPYLDGISAGYATLDLFRAIGRLPNPGVSTLYNPNYFMVGISQGAQAVSWAAQLHPTYAPELPLKAVIANATPARLIQSLRSVTAPTSDGGTSTTSAVDFANGKYSVGSMLVPFALAGASVYTGVDAFAGLVWWNPFAASWKSSAQRNCTYEQLGWLGSHPPDYWRPDPSFFNWYNPEAGSLATLVSRFNLGAVAPTLPVALIQGDQDDVAPHELVKKLQKDWCSRGGRVVMQTVASGTHISKTPDALWTAFSGWFTEVAAGRTQNYRATPTDTTTLPFCPN